ncbi:putative inositol monophosphatase [Phaeomoniella chlamydospora]|uniref:Inositol-1-monophosphatase n=1 Tax=Phaeomoniella chlamydospora TaxID=158046 RepID=A0A0G2G3D4_PHACM|nr:putative inositol monophosphatase [Phaeomoniella chlamydospora]
MSTNKDAFDDAADLVTETDRAVEKMVSTTLMSKYPTFSFLGEETYKPGMKLTSSPTFVVDPIDGTTNFVHRYPYVSISLGFAINKEPVVGVVFNPFTQQLYTGVKGFGSTLKDLKFDTEQNLPLKEPLEPLTTLSESLVAMEWGSDRSGVNYDTKVKTFANLARSKEDGGAMVHSLRSLGSAALNLCAVASGSIDIYWEGGCWAWDVCAGWVILKEAGGIIVDGNPGQWDCAVDGRKYLAVRGAPGGKGQKEIVEELWSHIDGKMEYES